MKYEGLFPIGTVVLLQNSTRRLMVIGYGQQKLGAGPVALYDYCGVLYPEGYASPDTTFLFNQDQVDRVYAMGYMDELAFDYLPRMEQAIKDVREKHKGESEG